MELHKVKEKLKNSLQKEKEAVKKKISSELRMEKRGFERKIVDYLAEVWIRRLDERGVDSYNDVGFRGTIRNISLSGAYFSDFINLNLTGVELGSLVRKKNNIKLIIHTPWKKVELVGKVSWIIDEIGYEAMGINFISTPNDFKTIVKEYIDKWRFI